jgi:hypothetical protein
MGAFRIVGGGKGTRWKDSSPGKPRILQILEELGKELTYILVLFINPLPTYLLYFMTKLLSFGTTSNFSWLNIYLLAKPPSLHGYLFTC